MQIPNPLYHKKKVRKMVKKPRKYRHSPEARREEEMCALVEMPTSGYMLTRQVLGKLMASKQHQRGTN